MVAAVKAMIASIEVWPALPRKPGGENSRQRANVSSRASCGGFCSRRLELPSVKQLRVV